MDELDLFNADEVSEEDLWNQYHAAAMAGADLADPKEENVSSDLMLGAGHQTADGLGEQRPRFVGEYACDVCGETFYTIVQLAKHRQFHDRDRPFQCSICGKRFLSRSHHHEHQRVHTGERPFPCERCDRSFTTHHNLKRHMTIHDKEEMYRCQQCGVLFCQEHEYKLETMRLPGVVAPDLPAFNLDPPMVALPRPPRPLPSMVPAAVASPLPPPVLPPPVMPTLTPMVPTPTPTPSSYSMEYQIPNVPSYSGLSSGEVKMSQVFVDKKKYKKKRKGEGMSLFDVSRNIAGHSPRKPELVLDADIPEYRRKGSNNAVQKKTMGMHRIAYDIEVVI
ncbi:zinc finger protein 652-like [Engraulis encrasicolus]|uniref:zinc finger protein 652-like n=1 Tax=Engraulis encrasicolus TaxID=184585 RepID=UPI002FD1B68B